jgi:hypothetical protein
MWGSGRLAGVGIAACVALTATLARAAEPSGTPATPDAWPLELRLDAYTALVGVTDDGLAPGIGAAAFVGIGPLQAGLSLLGETQIFGYRRVSGAAHVGLRVRPRHLAFDAAASVGSAQLHRADGSFFASDPGAGGSVWFLGVRAGVGFELVASASGRTRLDLNFTGFFEHDMNPRAVSYTFREESWLFGGEPTEHMGSRLIGSERAGLLIAASLALR